jgi:hypothetical protein
MSSYLDDAESKNNASTCDDNQQWEQLRLGDGANCWCYEDNIASDELNKQTIKLIE